jgi:8-oxo-dGTP pyrophosphatase MutT (NUDIX family)
VIYDAAVSLLESGLARPLPGPEAQDRLAPRPRREWPEGFNPARLRHAAGLLLVFPGAARAGTEEAREPGGAAAHIVLTVRSDSLGRHGGQVSLPGGVVDPGETFEAAALREAHEEIGVAPAAVRMIGPLTPLDIPVSGFRLHPVVGVAAAKPAMRPSDLEVARILEVDVDDLTASGCLTIQEWTREGRTLIVPAFRVQGAEIWGATAMVLAEFLTVLGWK